MIRSHFSSVMLRNSLNPGIPALLTRTTGGPTSVRTRSTAASTWARSDTSTPPKADCLEPRLGELIGHGLGRACSSRSSTTTANPSWASRTAMARPMPEPAPVTMATRRVLTRGLIDRRGPQVRDR